MTKLNGLHTGVNADTEITNPAIDWTSAIANARLGMNTAATSNNLDLPSLDTDGKCSVNGETMRTPATTSETLEDGDVRIGHTTIKYHVIRRIQQGAEVQVVPGLNRMGRQTTLYPEDAMIDGISHLRTLKVQLGEDGTFLSKRGFTYMSIPALAAKYGIPESTLRNHFSDHEQLKTKAKTIPARDVHGKRIIIYRVEDIKADLEKLQTASTPEAILDKDEYCEIEKVKYCSINGCLKHMLKDAKHKPTRKCLEVRITKDGLKSKKAKTLAGDPVNVYPVVDLERIIKVYFEEARVEKKGEKQGIYTDPDGQEYATLQTWLPKFGVGEKAFEKGFEEKFKGVWPEGSKIEGVDLGGNKSSLYLKGTVEEALSYILKAEAIVKEGICAIQEHVQDATEEALLQPPKIYKSDRRIEADHGDKLEISRCEMRRRMLRASMLDPAAKITIEATDRKRGTKTTVFDVDYALKNYGKK